MLGHNMALEKRRVYALGMLKNWLAALLWDCKCIFSSE